MAIRLLIGDDDPLVREALEVFFGRDVEFRLLPSVTNGRDAAAVCLSTTVDVALLDIRMPILNGIEAAAKITATTKCRVLILSTFKDDELIRGALSSGASGYLLKGCDKDEIRDAIRLVHGGFSVFDQDIVCAIRDGVRRAPGDLSSLSDRERAVAELVARGLPNREIADSLCLSDGTVKNHISLILSKLGLRQRTELALYCVGGHDQRQA